MMMQLNDILEEHSIKAISLKTKIPAEHLEALFANKFEAFKRVKTMGFISIIEREYGAELKVLRTAAKTYYDEFQEDGGITLKVQMKPEKKGKSKLLLLAALLLLGVATWYFLTQFDQKHFNNLLEFIDQNDTVLHEEESTNPSLKVEDLTISAVGQTESSTEQEKNVTSEEANNTVFDEAETVETNKSN